MIVRKNIEANYTKIPNTPDDYLNDPTITAKSKGILTQLLCKPDTWRLSVTYLVNTNKEGASAIRTAINELIGSGYIQRDVLRDKHGRIRGTQHVIFDHRVSPKDVVRTTTQQEQTLTPLDASPNLEQPLIQEAVPVIQEAVPEHPPTTQVKPQIRETPPNETDRIRKIQIRKIDPVLKNKDINKEEGVTTTTTQDLASEPVVEVVKETPSSSYPAAEDINSLLDLIPEQHNQPMVKALVNRAVKKYTPLEVEEAIVYSSAKVRGGWEQYKAYLDKALKNKWAAGYLDAINTTTPAVLSPGNFAGGMPGAGARFPNGSVTGSARMDSNYMACAQFLAEMGVED